MALGVLLGVVALCALLFVPIYDYWQDHNKLRRFQNASIISGYTNVWWVWEAWKGTRYLTLQEKHLNIGKERREVLRVGPAHLSFIGASAVKDIHGHGSVMEKGPHYDLMAGTHRHLADVVDRSEHKRKRKTLAAAFTHANIEKYEHVVSSKMAVFIRQMDQRCAPGPESAVSLEKTTPYVAQTVDFRRWAILFTQEFIAALGFSEDLGFLESGDDLTTAERAGGTLYQTHYRHAIECGMYKDSILVGFLDWYKPFLVIGSILFPRLRHYRQISEGFNDICNHLTKKRIKRSTNGEDLHDIFTALLHARNGSPNNYPFGELLAEAHVILNAGSDSTGIAMTNTIISLLENPSALLKLRQELDETLDPTTTVTPYHQIKNLPYLRAVIDESMRINPPSPFNLPRKTPPTGASIAGHWIPGNIQVSTATQAIHMDPTIWTDPDVFRPERWLSPDSQRLQQSFLVFTTGPRGCIGRNVTYLEQYVMLASFVHRYGFELAEREFKPTRYETVVVLVDRLPLRIWRRRRDVEVGTVKM